MASERGELTAIDRDVLESLHAHDLLTTTSKWNSPKS